MLVKRVFFLLNAAVSMAVLDLISHVGENNEPKLHKLQIYLVVDPRTCTLSVTVIEFAFG